MEIGTKIGFTKSVGVGITRPITPPLTTEEYGDLSITSAKLAFGTLEKIAEITPTSNITVIDITGLDIIAHKVYLLLCNFRNPTGVNTTYKIYVEGDYTDTNYYNQYIFVDGTTVSAARSNDPAFAYAIAGTDSPSVVWIFRGPGGFFKFLSLHSRHVGSSQAFELRFGSRTTSVTNITSIRIASSVTGGIGANSKVLLFKVSA